MREQVPRGDAAVEVVHGHVLARRREAAVDSTDDLLDLRAQLAVLPDVAAARDGDLDHGESSAELPPTLEQELDRAQPLDDALRVVEPVHTDEHAPVAELLAEPVQHRADALATRLRPHALRIDRDRMRRGEHETAVAEPEPRPVHRQVVLQPHARPDEVLTELLGLEGDDVRAEDPVDQMVPPRHARKELGGGERDVEEEADRAGLAGAAELGGEAGEVVVVHPEEAVRRRDLGRPLGEALVHLAVVAPPAPVDDDAVGEPVEERPEGLVREAVVVVLDLDLAQRDRDEPSGEIGKRVRHVGGAAVPAHP